MNFDICIKGNFLNIGNKEFINNINLDDKFNILNDLNLSNQELFIKPNSVFYYSMTNKFQEYVTKYFYINYNIKIDWDYPGKIESKRDYNKNNIFTKTQIKETYQRYKNLDYKETIEFLNGSRKMGFDNLVFGNNLKIQNIQLIDLITFELDVLDEENQKLKYYIRAFQHGNWNQINDKFKKFIPNFLDIRSEFYKQGKVVEYNRLKEKGVL